VVDGRKEEASLVVEDHDKGIAMHYIASQKEMLLVDDFKKNLVAAS
jgi:hypothetical protein